MLYRLGQFLISLVLFSLLVAGCNRKVEGTWRGVENELDTHGWELAVDQRGDSWTGTLLVKTAVGEKRYPLAGLEVAEKGINFQFSDLECEGSLSFTGTKMKGRCFYLGMQASHFDLKRAE